MRRMGRCFSSKGVKDKVSDILEDVESDEITALQEYLTLSRKADKQSQNRKDGVTFDFILNLRGWL